MARKVQVLLVDDLDGSDLGTNGETVAFGLGGERYEIDLSTKNAEKFRTVLGEYVSAARNVTRTGGSTSSRTTRRNSTGGRAARTSVDREQSNAIRGWARSNGWPKLGERGRIPAEVIEAFNANNARQMPLPAPAAPSLAETKREVPPRTEAQVPPKAPAGNSTKAEKVPAKDKVPATA